MLDLFNNQWIVGIGAGIVSGLFVFWITPLIFSKRYEAEGRANAEATNREVIYALRPGIAEGVIPLREVVEALVSATSRKYNALPQYVYGCKQIGEELIKEVMDSSFISAKQKADFCDAIKSLMEAPALPPFPSSNDEARAGTKIWTSVISAILATVTALTTLAFSIYNYEHDAQAAFSFPALSAIVPVVLPALFGVLGAVVAAYFASSRETVARRRRRNTRKLPDPTDSIQST